MRRFIVAVGAVLSFVGLSCQAQEAFRSVDVAEFERAVADDAYVVLDVRTPEEHAQVAQVPASLEEALKALEEDHEFLLQGDVFTPDLIETWIEIKRGEIDEIRQRVHPYEFDLYFAI